MNQSYYLYDGRDPKLIDILQNTLGVNPSLKTKETVIEKIKTNTLCNVDDVDFLEERMADSEELGMISIYTLEHL